LSLPSREDLEAFARTSSSLLGLRIDPAHLPSVIDNLEIILRHHEIVSEQLLPLGTEPAFVFRP
jgi:hypothetical protein